MGLFLICSLIGLGGGILSGVLGIGGATIIIPALIYFLKFNQHLAQGTTLALMVLPIGLLAAWTYFKSGHVDLKVAALICIGFLIGGLIGAKIAVSMPQEALGRIFGIVLLLLGAKMALGI
ncbi:MAG: sulfite exporter TauE/SafE family protein [Candidatus Kaelpia aquatica]|nr:sulfite exporter TauE/SafE family protein [Candidatus Kaelpia aquatica]